METNTETKPASTKDEIRACLHTLHTVAVVTVVMGVISLLFGITTVILTVPSTGPFASGSGITCGLGTILLGLFEILLVKEGSSTSPTKLKCMMLTVRCFIIVGFHFALLILANGTWALVVCGRGSNDEHCGGVHWSANIVVASTHLALGLTIVSLDLLAVRLYLKIHKTMVSMAKIHSDKMTEVA